MSLIANVQRAALGVLVTVLLYPHTSAAALAADQGRAVVVISVDGLAAFYLKDPKAEMPTIRALAAAGASATAMKVSAPSVTWPNHTTLVTGFTPARHGVVGNDYFDRTAGKPINLMTDPESDKERLVRVPTIYDVAKKHGMKTAAIRWPATRNAKNLDWTLPDVFSPDLLHQFTTPSLVTECKAAGIWSDGEIVRYGPREFCVVSDETCTNVFNFTLRTHHPNLALLHLTHVDTGQHLQGPRTPQAYAAIKSADELVRKVWDEVRRDYGAHATLLVVSDHGFSPVDRLILPNVPLVSAGLTKVKGGRAVAGKVRVVVEGGAALVYVLDEPNRKDVIGQLERLFGTLEGVSIVGPGQLHDHGLAEPDQDSRAPDLVLFAPEGQSFDDRVVGSSRSIPTQILRGAHGQDENLPCMSATFIAWGAGIRHGAELGEIKNTDVAPTIARLLNLTLPGTDGKVLSAALAE